MFAGEGHGKQRIPGDIEKDHPRRKLAQKYMLEHCLDVSRGLEYIHEKGYTHRDMKMENILVSGPQTNKLK